MQRKMVFLGHDTALRTSDYNHRRTSIQTLTKRHHRAKYDEMMQQLLATILVMTSCFFESLSTDGQVSLPVLNRTTESGSVRLRYRYISSKAQNKRNFSYASAMGYFPEISNVPALCLMEHSQQTAGDLGPV